MTITNTIPEHQDQHAHATGLQCSQSSTGSSRSPYQGRIGLVTVQIDEDFNDVPEVMIDTPTAGTPKLSPISPGQKLNKTKVYRSHPRGQYNKFVTTPSMQGAGNALSFADANIQGDSVDSPQPF
ncbi:hypothetical protein GUITHDRAFT_154454 [Guillardia theta CCMP2712]|uniref:Uncharacterized protein n=1 Tax=Guillardia theta (strain CCMP2712) TaxID=905079 RepID=L1ITB5_GUITC|nr:hypothetical protein GUITHDRAFT_154454 [Guillardia theta CCMP2712]EKX39322.1 hypothetical protein GUITHDRAFT_154454 [Guillardia theta CCMP2712]|mmetsp:Transcript_5035/g.18127  ORF Transcript_5035/g.18127 Transcript_5035/m.18127 type:complete len:125 (-) Transcript_5035:185-559(-)|eukprot:XP_005826302.1 hypothetical protein GUITHDRAFT_154454 [Guillardia theta CCMP2712]